MNPSRRRRTQNRTTSSFADFGDPTWPFADARMARRLSETATFATPIDAFVPAPTTLAASGRSRYITRIALLVETKRMRCGSMFETGLVPAALLAVLLAISAAPPAAARGLNGSFRAFFMKTFVEGCMKIGAADSDVGKLPRATLMSLCRCSATYIAARATPAQLDHPNSPGTLAIQAEATRACLHR